MTTTENSPAHVFTGNGTFLFTFVDGAGNTGSALATVSSIIAGGVCGNAIVESQEQCDA
jgi:outer membrane lipoprotein SlyB